MQFPTYDFLSRELLSPGLKRLAIGTEDKEYWVTQEDSGKIRPNLQPNREVYGYEGTANR